MADSTNTSVNPGQSVYNAAITHYLDKGYKYSQSKRNQPGFTDCSKC